MNPMERLMGWIRKPAPYDPELEEARRRLALLEAAAVDRMKNGLTAAYEEAEQNNLSRRRRKRT